MRASAVSAGPGATPKLNRRVQFLGAALVAANCASLLACGPQHDTRRDAEVVAKIVPEDGEPRILDSGPAGESTEPSQDHATVQTAEQSLRTSQASDMSHLSFDLIDGGEKRISDYSGRPLVVNFFARWCPPCVREMPDFEEVHQALGERVAFLGLSQDRNRDDARQLIEDTGVTYDTGLDVDLQVYEATGSMAMPTTAFVTADGALADVFAGLLDEQALRERIARVFGISDEAVG